MTYSFQEQLEIYYYYCYCCCCSHFPTQKKEAQKGNVACFPEVSPQRHLLGALVTATLGAKVISSSAEISFALWTTIIYLLNCCNSYMRQQYPSQKGCPPFVNYKVMHRFIRGWKEQGSAQDRTTQRVRSTTRTRGVLRKV